MSANDVDTPRLNPMRLSAAIERQIRHVEERLIDDYSGRISAGDVRDCVEEHLAAMTEVRVAEFIPVLVDREVRRQLDTATRSGHHVNRPRQPTLES